MQPQNYVAIKCCSHALSKELLADTVRTQYVSLIMLAVHSYTQLTEVLAAVCTFLKVCGKIYYSSKHSYMHFCCKNVNS